MSLYNNDFSGMNEDHLDRFIEISVPTLGLDGEGMLRAKELAKDFYFKTGRFERAHVNNVTDVSIYLWSPENDPNQRLEFAVLSSFQTDSL